MDLVRQPANDPSTSNRTLSSQYKTYKKLTLYTNTTLKQLIFNTLINSLPIVSFSTIK